jgi:superfamily II DNA or RNA helicase
MQPIPHYMTQSVFTPRKHRVKKSIEGSIIAQLIRGDYSESKVKQQQLSAYPEASGTIWTTAEGQKILIAEKVNAKPMEVEDVLLTQGGQVPRSEMDAELLKAKWFAHQPEGSPPLNGAQQVLASWRNQFVFQEEEVDAQDKLIQTGLRPPQIGALYATLAHWKVSSKPATIVMPTGTGKTETMLALLVSQRLPRLLVVVPNLALRGQITDKFLTLGLLQSLGVVGVGAKLPIVTCLKKRLKTVAQVDAVLSASNVVVTNIQVLEGCAEPALQQIAALCSHVFFDEAHHLPAKTWTGVARTFDSKPILQFTATPFRNDAKPIEGTIIFNYPLKKAQSEQYFRPVKFDPVLEFDEALADQAIAAKAVAALRLDLAAGLDHLMMARAQTTEKADKLLATYQAYPDLNPVVIHSKDIGKKEQKRRLEMINSRQSRILICVSMFGEGFDLPQLKVAALHNVHKSLAITLQFVGRFTRFKRDLGNATIVANLADIHVREDLRELYSEGADWNVLLEEASAGATGTRLRLSNFVKGFENLPNLLSLHNITPKMSAVVYYTTCGAWCPSSLEDYFGKKLIEAPFINEEENVVVCVTRSRRSVEWGTIRDLVNTEWQLYVVYWDKARKLLFINSNVPHTFHQGIAKAVAGTTKRVDKEVPFRVLHGLNQLTLTNLGLNHTLGRAVSFTMLAGNNILQTLTDAQQDNKTASNIFGLGYRDGKYTNVGCSTKGRFWSFRVAEDIPDWMNWCGEVGTKILDNRITIRDILKKVVRYEKITGRPAAVPIAIDWASDVLAKSEEAASFAINGHPAQMLYSIGLELLTHDTTSAIQFRLFSETQQAVVELVFIDEQVRYRLVSGTVQVSFMKEQVELVDWLADQPPTIMFHNRSLIRDGMLARLPEVDQPYQREKIQGWDWTGINITTESQGINRTTDTVQYHTIQELQKGDYDILFDDDNSGEAADIVALKFRDDTLFVDLYHCKFSGGTTPGHRTKDLYEVCGQAQKSVRWAADRGKLFRHLKHRETMRKKNYGTSFTRFETGYGDLAALNQLEHRARFSPMQVSVFIVQPGLSQATVSVEQLYLLAGTELYLQETYNIPFTAVGGIDQDLQTS